METNGVPDDSDAISIPATVRPHTIKVSTSIPQPSIAIRPNLWHNWTRIAIRAEARTLEARRRGLQTADIAEAIEGETLETMVAVSGVRHAFHHLYLDWHLLLRLEPQDEEHKVPLLATTEIPTAEEGRREWLAALTEIVADRNQIIHVAQDDQPVVPHPLGTNTSELDARFASERAVRAVDLMLDFYRRVLEAPSPPLADWSEKRQHVLDDFLDLRAAYQAHTLRVETMDLNESRAD